MKKTRWIALLTLTLAAVMLLASCGKGKVVALGEVLDETVAIESNALTLTQSVQVSKLTDYDVEARTQNLILFAHEKTETQNVFPYESTTYYKLAVYNMATKNVVWEANFDSKANSTTYSVELKSNYVADNAAMFTVKTSSTETINNNTRTTVRTALYDSQGMKMTETYGDTISYTYVRAGSQYLYVYADGTCYSFQEDGRYQEEFDYPEYAEIPSFDYTDGENFYAKDVEMNQILVYDAKFEQTNAYTLPADAENATYVVMRDGKILVQYVVELEDNAKKYDFINEKANEIYGSINSSVNYESVSLTLNEDAKYDMVTLLVDMEKGKAKELKTDLYLTYAYDMNELAYYNEEYGYGFSEAEEICAYVAAVEIVDSRMNTERTKLYTVDAKGNFAQIESVKDNYFYGVDRIAEDRWVYMTNNANYLIDEEGSVIGRLDDCDDVIGNYIQVNDKIYDMDLNLVLDLNNSRYGEVDEIAQGLLLRNLDGDLFLFDSNNATPKLIADKDNGYTYHEAGSNLIVVYYDDKSEDNDDQYIVYNRVGTELARYDAVASGVDIVYDNEYGAMISVDVKKTTTTGYEYVTQYYSFQ